MDKGKQSEENSQELSQDKSFSPQKESKIIQNELSGGYEQKSERVSLTHNINEISLSQERELSPVQESINPSNS